MSAAQLKMARLEAMVGTLEKRLGFRPDVEVIAQNGDGSWPELKTTASLVIERVRFNTDASRLQDANLALARDVGIERNAFELVAEKVRGRRMSDTKSEAPCTATPSEPTARHELRRTDGMMAGDAVLPPKLARRRATQARQDQAMVLASALRQNNPEET